MPLGVAVVELNLKYIYWEEFDQFLFHVWQARMMMEYSPKRKRGDKLTQD